MVTRVIQRNNGPLVSSAASVWIIASISLISYGAFAADVETAKQAVLAAWETTKSYSAELSQESTLDLGGASLPAKGTGSIKLLKQDAATLFHIVLDAETAPNASAPVEVKSHMDITSDGKTILTVMELAGERIATTKKNPTDLVEMTPPQLFETLSRSYVATMKPETYVSGHLCHVFAFTPDAEAQQRAIEAHMLPPRTLTLYFERKSGIPMKREESNADGALVTTTTVERFALNPELDASKFSVAPPTGVKLIPIE